MDTVSYVSIEDVAIGVLGSRVKLGDRLIPAAKTWFQLFPKIHVYTDILEDDEVKMIVKSSNHLGLQFHESAYSDPSLAGSVFSGGWFQAQVRYMKAFQDLFEREPNKKWYYFCDDDTYSYPNSLLQMLSAFHENDFVGIGSLFRPHHTHAQAVDAPSNLFLPMGGAGMVLSHGLAQKLITVNSSFSDLKPIEACIEILQVPSFPSDGRLAFCIYKLFGNSEMFFWERWRFHGYHPLDIKLNSGFRIFDPAHKDGPGDSDAPVSFHHIQGEQFKRLWNAHVAQWRAKNGTELFIDFTHVTAEFFNVGAHFVRWGYTIDERFATTGLEPVFSGDDHEKVRPRSFWQKYESGIKVHVVCSENMGEREVTAEEIGENGDLEFTVCCLKPQRYYVTNPGIGSPAKVTVMDFPKL